MLVIYLAWTLGNISEVAVTMVLIAAVLGIFAAIPFIAERYLDDRRAPLVADFVGVGVGDHAVLEPDDAVGELADPVVVRDDDDGLV
jgi:hypothetical protein